MVVSKVFKGLAGKKIIAPSKDFVRYSLPVFSLHTVSA